jgi:ribosomal protein S27E
VADYERHDPEKTLLHRVVRAELEPLLARARESGSPVARFVEREIRAYLDCGVLANEFLRVHCDDCGQDRLVAFSCKGRGFCPSCGGPTAAHLVERVLPQVPVRQWVATLPNPLRLPCPARDLIPSLDRELTERLIAPSS